MRFAFKLTGVCMRCLLLTMSHDVQFPKGMEEDLILTIAKDILHGLQYLHSHDLAHRDLKVCSLAPKSNVCACLQATLLPVLDQCLMCRCKSLIKGSCGAFSPCYQMHCNTKSDCVKGFQHIALHRQRTCWWQRTAESCWPTLAPQQSWSMPDTACRASTCQTPATA